MTRRRRTELHIVAAAATLGMVVPLVAALHLAERIDGDLAPRASSALGQTVSIGTVEVGLSGDVRIGDVRVGELLSLERMEVLLDVWQALEGDARIAEIRLHRPHLTVRAGAEGATELDQIRARWRQRRAARAADADSGGARHRPALHVRDGVLSLHLPGRGQLRVHDVTVAPVAGQLRARAGGADIEVRAAGARVRGQLGTIAADLQLDAWRMPRLMSTGGALSVESPGAPPLEVRAVTVLADADARSAERAMRVHGHIAGQPAAEISVYVDASAGGPLLRVQGKDVPLGPLQPWLPRSLSTRVGRATGSAMLQWPAGAGGSLAFAIDADVADVTVADARVASEPFSLTGRARLQASLVDEPDAHLLTVEQLSLALPAASSVLTARVTGSARYPRTGTAARSWIPATADIALEVPRIDCASALSAMPVPFRRQLVGLDMSGAISARAQVRVSRARIADTQLNIDIDHLGCRALRDAVSADPRSLAAAIDHRFPDGASRRLEIGQPDYVPLADLPSYLASGFVASEDARFFRHRGFDVAQIERSLAVDMRRGAFVRGGSTITQQLVKNAFLSHERTIARKFQEAILAWRVEASVGKRAILERYLNLIELGPDVFGIEPAAHHWFGKSARQLGVREAAFLVALTPAPRTISRRLGLAGGVDDATRKRIDTVLRIMKRERIISQRDYRRAAERRIVLTGDRVASR